MTLTLRMFLKNTIKNMAKFQKYLLIFFYLITPDTLLSVLSNLALSVAK